jgi:hypothetical protein
MGNKTSKKQDEAAHRIKIFNKHIQEGLYDEGYKGYKDAYARWNDWRNKYPQGDWNSVNPNNYDIFSCERISDGTQCVKTECMWKPEIDQETRPREWDQQQQRYSQETRKLIHRQGGMCEPPPSILKIRQPTRTKIKMRRESRGGSRVQKLKDRAIQEKRKTDGMRKAARFNSTADQSGSIANDTLYTAIGKDGRSYVFFSRETKKYGENFFVPGTIKIV